MKQLSIIIVNYNVKHFLEQALISVYKASQNLDIEVFVIDNNSVDGSVQMVQEKFPQVTLIANKQNTGFSKANNQGIKLATGKYILLLNPDTVVQEDTFVKIVEFMNDKPDCGGLGVKMINGEGEFLPESKRSLPTPWVAFYKVFGFARLFPKSKKFGKYHLSYLDNNKNHEVEVLSGAFMVIRKEVVDKIGMLDEDYFMYGEDIDYSYRITKAGYKNYYFSETQIIHYKGESTKKGSLNYVLVFYNAMLIFAGKHFSKGKQSMFMLLIKFAIYFRASLSIFKRFANLLGHPLLDYACLFATTLSIKGYWEKHVKYTEGGTYPETFETLATPIYALIFVSYLIVLGGYKRPFQLRPIFLTAFLGFITIATISYLFPSINFSRGIVVFTTLSTVGVTLSIRAIINYFSSGHNFFDKKLTRKTAIIGNEDETQRVINLIQQGLGYECEIMGIITTSPSKSKKFLGELNQIEEIVNYYKLDDLVFCNANFSTRDIISIMSNLRNKNLTFKIIPKEADYMVGPNNIFVKEPNMGMVFSNLTRPYIKFQKQVFDFVVSLGLVLSFPLFFWIYKNPFIAMKKLLKVFIGNYHLVGYIDGSNPDLPPLKDGILDISVLRKNKPNALEVNSLDKQYARNYSIGLDVQIIMSGIKNIGLESF